MTQYIIPIKEPTMFHFYAYHKKSKQLMLLTPKQAQILNNFSDVFLQAQKDFLKTHGRRWTPSDPFPLPESFNMEAYDKVAKFVNLQHAVRNTLFNILRVDVSKEDFGDRLIRRF